MAYGLLLATALFWSGNAVAGKFAVGHISPFLLTLIRWCLATIFLAILGARHIRHDWPQIRRHAPLLFVMGGCGFAGFNALFYVALNYTSAINVVIIQSAMPMLIILGNFMLFRTPVTLVQILGVILGIFGIAYMVSAGQLQRLLSLAVNSGDALMLIAAIVYAGYTIALRWKPKMHWTSFLFALALSSLTVATPLAGWEALAGRTIVPDATGWTVALYTAIFPAVVSQAFFVMGVQALGPNRAGIFVNTVPVFGALLSILLLGEVLQPYHLISLVIVMAGIAIAERSASNRAKAAAGQVGL